MSELVGIRIVDSALKAALRQMQLNLGNMKPAMRDIAQVLANQTERNFAAQGRPGWKALKNPSEKRKGGMILQDSGQLAASITTSASATEAVIGTNKVYAAIHQFGGKTKAHTIRPVKKKVLAFGGRFAKSVNHPGSDIPARPFLPVLADGSLQPEASEPVLEAALQHLRRGAGI
ncbi:MAG: phage virion morphosis protein [Burkholderiaceae bacterium]|nr:phage virion morphosis protein [Burkholderiaceae bacterium]